MLFISPIIPSITSGVVRSRADLLCGSKYEAPDRVHSSSLSRFVFWTWGHASVHRPTRNGSRSSKARRDDHQWRRVYRLKVSQNCLFLTQIFYLIFKCFFRVNRGMIPNWLWNSLRQPGHHNQERVTYQRMARETSEKVAENIRRILAERQDSEENQTPYFRVYSK